MQARLQRRDLPLGFRVWVPHLSVGLLMSALHSDRLFAKWDRTDSGAPVTSKANMHVLAVGCEQTGKEKSTKRGI
jgi:hypothetical protein